MPTMNPQQEVIKHSVQPWGEGSNSYFPLHTALVRLFFGASSYTSGASDSSMVLYLQGVTFNVQRQIQPITELGSWKVYNVPIRTMGTIQAQRAVGSAALTSQVGTYFKKMEIKPSTGQDVNVGTIPTFTLWHGRVASAGVSIQVGQAVMMEHVTFVGDVADWMQA